MFINFQIFQLSKQLIEHLHLIFLLQIIKHISNRLIILIIINIKVNQIYQDKILIIKLQKNLKLNY
jgi:hypothetical protein